MTGRPGQTTKEGHEDSGEHQEDPQGSKTWPLEAGGRHRVRQRGQRTRTQPQRTRGRQGLPSHRVQGRRQEEDQRRTRPGHRAQFRGAASQCGQLFFSRERQQRVLRKKTSAELRLIYIFTSSPLLIFTSTSHLHLHIFTHCSSSHLQ